MVCVDTELEVKEFKFNIPSDKLYEIKNFMDTYYHLEPINYDNVKWFFTYEDYEVKACMLLGFMQFNDKTELPRILYMAWHPVLRRTKKGFLFLLKVQKLVGKIYDKWVACTNKSYSEILEFERKFGFTKFHETDKFYYLVKNINKEKDYVYTE
jgi:hypothetical protein